MIRKFIIPVQIVIFLLCVNNSIAQETSVDEKGIETTDYGKVVSIYDPFTDHLTISTHNEVLIELNERLELKMSPIFIGSQECYQWECGSFIIVIKSDDTTIVDLLDFSEGVFSQKDYPALFSNYRDELTVSVLNENYEIKNDLKDFSSTMLAVEINDDQINRLIEAETTMIRIDGTVISFGEEIKSNFIEIQKILNERRLVYNDKNEVENSSPYELKWEGNIKRDPIVQPLPQNTANIEGIISVRFQVKPNGSVGLIIPLKKMDQELEKEVTRTLRSWKFSKLPSNIPQQDQWGTITFRFVFD